MSTSVRRFTQGDRFPPVIASFRYRDPSLLLSDAIDPSMPVTFTMRAVDLAEPTIDGATATLVSSTGGLVVLRYDWAEGDTDRVAEYRAQFRIDLGGGSTASFPSGGYLRLVIADDLEDG